MKCQAVTKSGAMCSRDAIDDTKFCWQHRNAKIENTQQSETNPSNIKLNKIQLKSIDMLVTGKFTKTEIAEKCCINRVTLYRWLDNEDFQKAYRQRLAEIKENFDPQLLQMINNTMKSCDPSKLEGELSKIEAIERLFKLHNLLNNLPTDITKNEHSGMMGHEVVNKYDYMTEDQVKKIREHFKKML